MRCVDPGRPQTPTILIDGRRLALHPKELRELERSVWRVRSGFSSFLASAVLRPVAIPQSNAADELRLRYDPGCMTVADQSFVEGALILSEAVKKLEPRVVNWEPELALVIDNWRILHGRGTATAANAGARRLERILVAAAP
jgi:hypothetical protein